MNDIASKLLQMLTPEGSPERCGLVLKTGRIVEVSNVAENPVTGFRMNSPEVLNYLQKKRATPVATWHTHPGADPNFSMQDYAGFVQWPEFDHYIVGLRAGKPTVVKFSVVNDCVIDEGEIV